VEPERLLLNPAVVPDVDGFQVTALLRSSALALLLLGSCSTPPACDLSHVDGIDRVEWGTESRALLEKNGFVVLAVSNGDISAYFSGLYGLPKFITVDVGIELFLVELEQAWVKLEAAQVGRLKKIHARLWDAALARERSVPERGRAALRRLLGLIAAGRLLLDPAWTLPESPADRSVVEADVARAIRADGTSDSALWNRSFRWNVFRPLGPYAATEELQRLYRFVRWWGFAGLQRDDPEERLCAGMLAAIVESTDGLVNQFREVDSTYDSLLGPPDGVTLDDLLGGKDFPPGPTPILESEGDRLRVPGQKASALRLLPPRLTPEALAFAQVLDRRSPRGLDVLAVRGNPRARAITGIESAKIDAMFSPSHFQSRLWDLCDSLSRIPADEHLPRFMRTEAYQDRGLAAGLATWAGAREIYAVQAKDVFERKGILKFVPPLIDPNLEAWQRLIDLCRTAGDVFNRDSFKESAAFADRMKSLAERQRRGEILDESSEWIHDIQLSDYLRNALMCAVRKDWPVPLVDRRVCISFATVTNASGLQADTTRWAGKACSPIFAIAEHDGKLQLYLGGVLDYREFDLPAENTLTRDEFRVLMDSKEAPPAPPWTASYRGK